MPTGAAEVGGHPLNKVPPCQEFFCLHLLILELVPGEEQSSKAVFSGCSTDTDGLTESLSYFIKVFIQTLSPEKREPSSLKDL